MDREHWQDLRTLLERLLERTPAERAVLLADVRGRDPSLAAELVRLLRVEPHTRSFIEPPGDGIGRVDESGTP